MSQPCRGSACNGRQRPCSNARSAAWPSLSSLPVDVRRKPLLPLLRQIILKPVRQPSQRAFVEPLDCRFNFLYRAHAVEPDTPPRL